MQSKNKPKPTAAERAYIARVASLSCVVCGASPVEVHEPKQGAWFASIALCADCHRGQHGWHGDRLHWKLNKVDEIDAINETVRQAYGRGA